MRIEQCPWRMDFSGTEPGYVEQGKGKVLTLSEQSVFTDSLGSCVALIMTGEEPGGNAYAVLVHWDGTEPDDDVSAVLAMMTLVLQKYGAVHGMTIHAIGGDTELDANSNAIRTFALTHQFLLDKKLGISQGFDDSTSSSAMVFRKSSKELKIYYQVDD